MSSACGSLFFPLSFLCRFFYCLHVIVLFSAIPHADISFLGISAALYCRHFPPTLSEVFLPKINGWKKLKINYLPVVPTAEIFYYLHFWWTTCVQQKWHKRNRNHRHWSSKYAICSSDDTEGNAVNSSDWLCSLIILIHDLHQIESSKDMWQNDFYQIRA